MSKGEGGGQFIEESLTYFSKLSSTRVNTSVWVSGEGTSDLVGFSSSFCHH